MGPDFPEPITPSSTRLHSAGLLSGAAGELHVFTFPNIIDILISNNLWSHVMILKGIKTYFHTGRLWLNNTSCCCPLQIISGLITSRSCAVISVWVFCSPERKKQSGVQLMHWPLHFRKKTSNPACKTFSSSQFTELTLGLPEIFMQCLQTAGSWIPQELLVFVYICNYEFACN